MSYLVITTEYKVKKDQRDNYLKLMTQVRQNSLQMGAVNFYLMEDDAVTNYFIEMMVFDSWLQYENARKKPQSRAMEATFEQLDQCLEEGIKKATSNFMKCHLGDFLRSRDSTST